MDTSRVCSCGKICKNEKGLKIHRTKMGCSVTPILERRKGQPNETEEEMNQETHHSVQHLHVQEEEVMEENEAHDQLGMNLNSQQEREKHQGKEGVPPTPRIKWPTAASKKEWIQFDEDASKVLQSALAGDVDRKIKAMSTIIYAMGKDRFGVEEQKSR
ncbi:unnamed protein product [Mytilus edulis]|uniref:Uncharacterized protein n=1 Tax=Mytilus edulis TaxID=6550 RepID=A0A8S3TRI2_MYTED|nr:unnamed protein product [Mytilus edulis]